MSEKWQDCPHGSCRRNNRCVYIPCWVTTTTRPPNPSLEELLALMRQQGWLVAVHNDYRHNGTYTFWLFTNKESGRFVKGEAEDDLTAVQQCLEQVKRAYIREHRSMLAPNDQE
jgi:ribulose bisphosphate carboxylase small subunit